MNLFSPNGPSPILQSLILEKPYVRLRSAPGHPNPNFAARNLELWNASTGCCTPATVPLSSSEEVLLILKFKWDGDLSRDWELWGKFRTGLSAFTIGPSLPKLNPSDGSWDWEVVANDFYNDGVPSGFKDTIIWEFTYKGKQFSTFETPLALYGISNDLPDYWSTEGIPWEFLDLFVLPTTTEGLKDRNSWITWVVKKCFASTFDSMFQEQNPTIKPIHSYRYDTLHGDFSFVSDGGAVFNLNGWLSGTLKIDTQKYTLVNCYDQSALLQTALSLGISYTFRQDGIPVRDTKGNELRSIGKIYKEPYGFIPATDLVGWGETNNPFFKEGLDGKILQLYPDQKYDQPIASDRQPFKNHAFVYIRHQDGDQDQLKDVAALDACAGPHADPTDTLKNYLYQAIDVYATNHFNVKGYVSPQWSDGYKKKWYEFSNLDNFDFLKGVVSTDIQPVIPRTEKEMISKTLLKMLPNFQEGRPTDVSHLIQFCPVPVEDLIRKIIDLLPGPQNDYKIVNFPRAKGKVGSEGTSFSVNIWTNLNPKSVPKYMSIDLHILSNFWQAIDWSLHDLNSNARKVHDVFSLDKQVYDWRQKHFYIPPSASGGKTVLVRQNIFLNLSGHCPANVLDSARAAADKFIVSFAEKPMEIVATDQFNVKPDSVNFGSGENLTFSISEKNPSSIGKLEKVRVAFHNNYMVPVQNPEESTQPNAWTVECALNPIKFPPGTKDVFHENLEVSFAFKDTFYTINGTWPIRIAALVNATA